MLKVLCCFVAGAIAGIGTGFVGLSAAAPISPILVTFLGIPAYQAIGIGLSSDVLASGVSAYIYKKNGNLDIKRSIPLLISVILMTMVGSYVASLLPDRAMGSASQVMMIFLGLKFILKPINNTKEAMVNEDEKKRIIKAIAGGILVGFTCGFVGAGGGIMLLFVLTSLLGYEMHMAVGTSVFIMAFTALTGSLSHFAIEPVEDIASLILCVLFTFIWARIASKIANKLDNKTLNRIVGIILIISSAIILTVNLLLK